MDRTNIVRLFRVAVSTVLLAFVVSRAGFDRLSSNAAAIPIGILAIAALVSVLGVVLSAVKWRMLLGATDIEVSFRTAVLLYYIGSFYNAFLPSVIGGDTARIYHLYSEVGDGPGTTSSVVVERLLGLSSIFTLVLVGTVMGHEALPSRVVGPAIVGSFLGLVGLPILVVSATVRRLMDATLFRIPTLKVGSKLRELHDAVREYRAALWTVAAAFLLSILFRFMLIGINVAIAHGLGLDIAIWTLVVFVPTIELFLFLPISIQGFGVREAAYLYMFGQVGVPAGLAVTFGIVIQVLLKVLNNVLGGFVYAFRDRLLPDIAPAD